MPGTKFYEAVRQELGQKQNWTDSDDLAMMYRGTYLTEFYRALHRAVHAEFRLRRSAAELARVAPRPRQWRTRHLRLLAAMPLHAVRLVLARWKMNLLGKAQPKARPATLLQSRG